METIPKYTELKLEKINSLIHSIGILFGLVCVPILITRAIQSGLSMGIIGSSIYSFCFFLVFTFSTLYHAFQKPAVKRLLEILDHISIYFLIAGTYTPLILIYVNNPFGFTLLVILWSLTLFGIVFKLFFTGRYEIVSVAIYLIMGWILIAGGKSFFTAMPVPVIILVVAGGVLYSAGVVFYAWKKYILHHAVWHLFVLAAAICHFIAVLLSV